MPDIKFPDPSIDLRDAFAWVVANVGSVNHGMGAKADLSRVFFMGHSAGSTSIATLMLLPGLLPADLRSRIVGLVVLSGAYDFRGAPSTSPEFLRQYFGPSTEDVRKREPLGLLENAPKAILSDFPPALALIGEYEFPPLLQSHGNFVPVLRSKVSSPVEELLMKGHNHLSPSYSLFSGEGEDWGFEVSSWMKGRSR
ncbi:hypothetical protein EIP86_009317 [Pleurotus ostreatoroseus]|nr:hypothetical protein EIP86_009317 [Pleurotus ostreatoroseus]